jgi:hypothetical protein
MRVQVRAERFPFFVLLGLQALRALPAPFSRVPNYSKHASMTAPLRNIMENGQVASQPDLRTEASGEVHPASEGPDEPRTSNRGGVAGPSSQDEDIFPGNPDKAKYKNIVLELDDYPSKPGKKKRRRARLLILRTSLHLLSCTAVALYTIAGAGNGAEYESMFSCRAHRAGAPRAVLAYHSLGPTAFATCTSLVTSSES